MEKKIQMTMPELMLAEHETDFFHDSTFVQLNDGRILHASGTRFNTSDDGGITWTEPVTKVDVNGDPVGGGGTSLIRLDGDGVGLASMRRGEPNSSEWLERDTYIVYWRSDDAGETWEAPVRMTPPWNGAYCYQDVFLRTSSGRIILPVYVGLSHTEHPRDPSYPRTGKLVFNQYIGLAGHFWGTGTSAVIVCYSDDDGRTWKKNNDGELLILLDWAASVTSVGEPSVAEVTPGTLLMMMRTKIGRIYQSWSFDDGETWTAPQPTVLAATTTPAQIRKIPSTGHMLVVWNQENEEDIKGGFNRMRLSSAISRDGGGVWEFFQNVQSIDDVTRVDPGPIRANRPAEQYSKAGQPAVDREPQYAKTAEIHGRWSYPSVFVMEDRVLVAHTYTHYEEHSTRAELIRVGGKGNDFNQKLKVLPIEWFYGGKEPTDSPYLRIETDIAVP